MDPQQAAMLQALQARQGGGAPGGAPMPPPGGAGPPNAVQGLMGVNPAQLQQMAQQRTMAQGGAGMPGGGVALGAAQQGMQGMGQVPVTNFRPMPPPKPPGVM